MLSVLMETRNSEEGLARTLASLVSGAVEGVVREVIVCDLGSTDGTRAVADQAGCRWILDGGLAKGMAIAKSDWLLLLEPGARLVDGWIESTSHHVTGATRMAARFSRARTGRPPFLARIFSHRRGLAEGLLITKRQALSLSASAKDGEGIARGLATRRLAAEIVVADPG